MTKGTAVGELNGVWSFLLKTWLSAAPVVAGAIIANISWLNYQALESQAKNQATDEFIVRQKALQEQDAATQVQILISLGKISTELELQRKK